jgi:predicted nucleotidyltransferase
MVDKDSIAHAVKNKLQALYGDRLAKLILYGSVARGDEDADSDIDFLVVLRDDDIQTGAELRFMNAALYDLDLRFNATIAAHPTTLKRYTNSDYLYYKNVRREGVEV